MIRNLNDRLAANVILALIFTIGTLPLEAHQDRPVYSVQVAALPLAEMARGLALIERLKSEGYLAYHFRHRSKDQDWLRIRIGAFTTEPQAKDFAEQLKRTEAMDSFVTMSPVRVQERGDIRIVTTPNAIWIEDGASARELFQFLPFSDSRASCFLSKVTAELAPDASTVAIAYRNQLIRLPISGGETQIIADFDNLGNLCQPLGRRNCFFQPVVKWSPDGAWIALVPERGFEIKSDLWVVPSVGGKPRHLVDNSDTQDSVKSFVWHPSLPVIFYVSGYVFGTVSPGGSIYAVDLEGRRVLVCEPDDKRFQQLRGELAVRDGYLHYQVIEFTENYLSSTATDAKIPLPPWPPTE